MLWDWWREKFSCVGTHTRSTVTLYSAWARLWKFQRFTHIFHGPGPGCPVTATLAPVRGLADRSRTVTTSRTVPPVTTRWPTTPSTNIIKMHSGHLVINNYNLTPHARQFFKNASNPPSRTILSASINVLTILNYFTMGKYPTWIFKSKPSL